MRARNNYDLCASLMTYAHAIGHDDDIRLYFRCLTEFLQDLSITPYQDIGFQQVKRCYTASLGVLGGTVPIKEILGVK